jgi:hypothetical protein
VSNFTLDFKPQTFVLPECPAKKYHGTLPCLLLNLKKGHIAERSIWNKEKGKKG